MGISPFGGPTAQPGQVLEVGVRRVTDQARFAATRPAFIELLSAQPGVRDSWEFQVVKGKNADNLTVGMTVYDNREATQAVIASILDDPVTQAYFATFEPVALQYATATTND